MSHSTVNPHLDHGPFTGSGVTVGAQDETYDLFDEAYVADPFPLWDRLRETCPVARSEAGGGSWMLTRYQDVTGAARDTARFSSSSVTVLPRPEAARAALPAGSPPITCDPPEHRDARRPLSTWFSARRAAQLEPVTRSYARELAAGLARRGRGDAATQYARRIPVAVIGSTLGIAPEAYPEFVALVTDVFSNPDDTSRGAAVRAIADYFSGLITSRRARPGDDFLSALLREESASNEQVLGTVSLVLAAGIDTAASVIGSALWHLATHPADRTRLVEDPALVPSAVEEFLRAYAPATMARILTTDLALHGRELRAGDRVLLNFPAANRDPAVFDAPACVRLDRLPNRHLAFGSGIHHCVGAHLARMEITVALQEWLAAIPEFHLDPDSVVSWVGGQSRGPASLPVMVGAALHAAPSSVR